MSHSRRTQTIVIGSTAVVALSIISFLNFRRAPLRLRGTRPEATLPKKWPTILAFGDSLTQQGFNPDARGWVSQLSNFYSRKADVINRGFSGYNTLWVEQVIDEFLPLNRQPGDDGPILVIMCLGANDMALPNSPQHVPVSDFEREMESLIRRIRSSCTLARLLIVTPPPVHEAKWKARCDERARDEGKEPQELVDRTSARAAKYASASTRVATREGIPVVDLYALLGSGDQELAEEYLSDGLHLSASGNDAFFKGVVDAITNNFPEILPSALSMQGPDWSAARRGAEV